ncbi:MAG TPA: outer membrane beta-barrel protein [Dongiaceae bacterium]|nr:outer membrane beta-barrel protein [Dongiaceae bacterium]
MKGALGTLLAAATLLAGLAGAARAQNPNEAQSGDAALTYHWVRSNAAPGQCGCFSLNGGGLSGSWNFRENWAIAAELSSETRGASVSQGYGSLTLTSFVAGVRYRAPQNWTGKAPKLQPFGEALIGSAHAGGSEAGVANGTNAFALRLGGGVDVPLNAHFAVRAVQLDWFRTGFANLQNDRQNNFLVATGLVFRWSSK